MKLKMNARHYIKKKIGIFIIVMLLISLVSCASQKDSFKFIYEKADLPNQESFSYEVNIGKEVGGAAVVAELWMNGECAKSSSLILNNETKALHISILRDSRKNDDNTSTQGLNIQMDTDEVSGSLLTYFELPEDISGYSFEAYKDKEVIPVNAGQEMILGAMAFDTGVGVRVIDLKSLIDDPERLKEYSCILVIRSSFAEALIEPQAETDVSSAVISLTDEEISDFNKMFELYINENSINEICCFFTSYYDSPAELNLQEFLAYYPYGTILDETDEEEFAVLIKNESFPFQSVTSVKNLPVPIHRYSRQQVNETLQKYAGITTADVSNTEGVLYLEEYDAYYNYTSDFGLSTFTCVRGEKEGDVIRLYSDTYGDGTAAVLTLKSIDNGYMIQAFQSAMIKYTRKYEFAGGTHDTVN